MRKSLTLFGAAIVLAASQASAADLPRKAPVYTPAPAPVPFSWTGFYIGGHVGGAWANVDYTHTNTLGLVETFSQDDSSWTGGVHGGGMYQWGNIVFGIEGT